MIILPQKKHILRNKFDKYITPYSVTQQLLDTILLDKTATILEPCCSEKLCITKILEKNGFTNVTSNIYDETKPETDLFNLDETNKFDYIITNTPYGKTIPDIIEKFKKIALKKIICLYPISTLHGTKRYNKLWLKDDFQLKEILMFVRPPFLKDSVQEDGCYQSGINAYGWFVWEKGYDGEIMLKLIDNYAFINRKKSQTPA